jgi:hypothetical protein
LAFWRLLFISSTCLFLSESSLLTLLSLNENNIITPQTITRAAREVSSRWRYPVDIGKVEGDAEKASLKITEADAR